jgi:hypothetical protein
VLVLLLGAIAKTTIGQLEKVYPSIVGEGPLSYLLSRQAPTQGANAGANADTLILSHKSIIDGNWSIVEYATFWLSIPLIPPF